MIKKSIHVFESREIPSQDVPSGPRHRDFSAHQTLRDLLPTTGRVALAWIEAREGDSVERSAALDTMLLVLRGGAHLADGRSLAAGDVVTIPAEGTYRLIATAPNGFEALAMTFGRTAADTGCPEDCPPEDCQEEVSSLAELLERNEQRARIASRGAMFRLVDDGTLDDPKRRATFLRHLRPLSDMFQKTMIARQATCSDHTYEQTFLAHFKDEFGHNMLLPRDDVSPPPDPVMSATLSWFTHQMLVRDNSEKTVLVHLVLEGAAEAFFGNAATREVFRAAGAMDYYEAHLEDEAHKDLGAQLLAGLHPLAYRRLHRMLEDGWDMYDAMGNRLAELVRLEDVGAA